MARMELELPAVFPFAVEMPVRITDVNYGRHLGNDAVFGLLHEARLRFLAHYGFSEIDAGGPGLIMAEAVCLFRGQAGHGDRLCIEVAAANPAGSRFDLFYRMRHAEHGATIVEARTGMLCFDYERGRPARMPEAFRSVFGGTGEPPIIGSEEGHRKS